MDIVILRFLLLDSMLFYFSLFFKEAKYHKKDIIKISYEFYDQSWILKLLIHIY